MITELVINRINIRGVENLENGGQLFFLMLVSSQEILVDLLRKPSLKIIRTGQGIIL